MNKSTDCNMPSCANCGKGEDSIDSLKACTACKSVKYCNRECQIAHRKQHKKECMKRAAELHDEALFKDPPPPKDCPICFLPMLRFSVNSTFKSCCGKVICSGCIIAMLDDADARGKEGLCAFCRKVVASSYEEELRRTNKLIEDYNNANAYNALGDYYSRGHLGLPRDMTKANELFLKGGKLGCAEAYINLGYSYTDGLGVGIDEEKAKHYWELAAMGGDAVARHNLGCMEAHAGNIQRSKKHFIIAANAGYKRSLDNIKEGFMKGFITKDEYANAMRAYQDIQDESKSAKRDKAAADIEQYPSNPNRRRR